MIITIQYHLNSIFLSEKDILPEFLAKHREMSSTFYSLKLKGEEMKGNRRNNKEKQTRKKQRWKHDKVGR